MVASGVTAAIVLVATRLLERRRHELPAIVTFRPAFWLLVPGSMGLAALTNLAGPTPTTTLILTVAETVLAISIGVQVGAAISEALAGRSAPEESGRSVCPCRADRAPEPPLVAPVAADPPGGTGSCWSPSPPPSPADWGS